ncbi:MAG: phosphatidate cytidylyltransferase [Butyricicoccus sp.]|nr:phosphatidate cytidylyltransferase [Butyricicoccus sp.]
MKARVLFGVIGFVFVLLALYVFPPVVMAIALTVLATLATYELTEPTGLVKNPIVLRTAWLSALLFGVFGAIAGAGDDVLLLYACLTMVVVVALFAALLRHHDTVSFPEITVALFGGVVLPIMLLSLWRIFSMDGGEFLVLLPLVAAWGSDTCALFAGMAFGKHKLAPVVSPKKTVEGAIGGVVGATLLMLLVVYLFNRFADLNIHYAAAALMGAIGAVIGQVGDLSFSIIKRQTGIKDYSHIFPGHGGVLDRFDSVIFVAPVAELILRLFAA